MFTLEQQAIIRWAIERKPGDQAVAEAGAGTGKTTTILAVARALYESANAERVLYLVFNRRNRIEAQAKFHGLADVHTINSFAYKALQVSKLGRALHSVVTVKTILTVLDIKGKVHGYSPWQYGKIIQETLDRYCQSADEKVKAAHVNSAWGRGKKFGFTTDVAKDTRQVFEALKPGANTTLPLSHDLYLKEWINLGCPYLNRYTLVTIDEAQDLSFAQCKALTHSQSLLLVGDDAQGIYGFRGAVSAMQRFPQAKHFPLTQSFRFGPKIAALATAIIHERVNVAAPKPLQGLEAIESVIGRVDPDLPHARIYRTNYQLILDALYYRDRHIPIQIIGDMREVADKLESAYILATGQRRHQPLHFSIARFKEWSMLEKEADKDPELGMLVELIEGYGNRITHLVEMLRITEWDQNPTITLVSGHRSKGLEFNHCVIAEDFDRTYHAAARSKDTAVLNEEINLMYVAVTRAQQTLELKSSVLRGIAQRRRLLKAS